MRKQYNLTPNHRDNTFLYLKLDKNDKLQWKYMNCFVEFKNKLTESQEMDIIDDIQDWILNYVHEKVILDNIEQRSLINEDIFDIVCFSGNSIKDFFPETSDYSVNFYYPLSYDY